MADKTLNQCNDKFAEGVPILDPVPPYCENPIPPSLRQVEFESATEIPKREGIGRAANCSPMQRGWAEDLRSPSRETIVRNSQVFRGVQEAIKEMFSNLVVFAEDGVAHQVPIIPATPEKAVAFILQENIRKDSTFVAERVRLPILSYHRTDIAMNQQRYIYSRAVDRFRDQFGKPGWVQRELRERDTVFGRARGIPVDVGYQVDAWTMYQEDMNQIIEQIFLKFDPVAYIRIQDVNQEIIVRLDSTATNNEVEPGDRQVRVVKHQFNMTIEMWVPQPIVRNKAVLDIKADIIHGITDEEIREVLAKLEIVAKET